jgi:hypothetical protein
MAKVCFTQNLQRHVRCPDEEVVGATVREVLDGYFVRHPSARSYVVDEQGALRPHVVVFVGEARATDRVALTDAVPAGVELWVMQALSGG